MIGPSGRYTNVDHPELLRGYFRSGYISDYGDRKTDLLGRPIPKNRAYAEWQHQQLLTPSLTLNAQLNWWKDSEVLRDFRPRAFFPVQEPDTFVESVHTGANYFVSLFNPRSDEWKENFEWRGPILFGRTTSGRATISLLRIKLPERIEHRRMLMESWLLAQKLPPG